jgi:hypothetical protein
MATTTPNFGWTVPTSTDLVKNGATAIETLGDGIDASFVDLKGGTTGQVLAKASNTDLDYTWIANDTGDITGVTAGTGISGGGTSGTVTVTNSMATAITTAGDLIKGTGSGTFDRLGIGTTGQVLTVSSGAPAWATPAGGGGITLLSTTTLSGSNTLVSSISQSYKSLFILVVNATNNTGNGQFLFKINNTSSGQYAIGSNSANGSTASNYTVFNDELGANAYADRTNADNVWSLKIDNYTSTSNYKPFAYTSGFMNSTPQRMVANLNGVFASNTAVSSINFRNEAGTLAGGTIYVYGVS